MKKIAILLLSLLMIAPYASEAKRKPKEFTPQQLEFIQKLDASIMNQTFVFHAERVLTQMPRDPYKDITYDQYSVTVNGPKITTSTNRITSSIFSPFELDTDIIDYTVSGSSGERNGIKVTLKARNVDNRLCYLSFFIFDDGSANMLFGGSKRLQFYGKIEPLQ